HRWWTEDRLRWLVGAGTVFGVGLTMKWNIASLMLGAAVVTFGRIVWKALWPAEPTEKKKKKKKRQREPKPVPWRELGAWALAFVLVPTALYLVSFTPYFLSGYTWDNWT